MEFPDLRTLLSRNYSGFPLLPFYHHFQLIKVLPIMSDQERFTYILVGGRTAIVVSIQEMTLQSKLVTNGYSWMRKAGLLWHSVDEFKRDYGDIGEGMVKAYSRKWHSVLYRG